MTKETSIERLEYFTLVVGLILNMPMSDEYRHAVARHVEGKLPDAALRDLHTGEGMVAALTAIEAALKQPRVLLKSQVLPNVAADPS